jgi:hypothetical protein
MHARRIPRPKCRFHRISFLLLPLICVSVAAADRVAVIAVGGGDAETLVPLVEPLLRHRVYGAQPDWHPSADSPEIKRLLSRMDHSPNPPARLAAAAIRSQFPAEEDTAFALARLDPTFAPGDHSTQPAGSANLTCRQVSIPLESFSFPQAWSAAGPDADLCFGRLPAHKGSRDRGSETCAAAYLRKDGFSRILPRCAQGSGPVFDGRYVWLVGSVRGSTALHVYDTQTDQFFSGAFAEGVPPADIDIARLAPIRPGCVCVVVSINNEATRTWIAMATIDETFAVSCQVLQECICNGNRGRRRWRASSNIRITIWIEPIRKQKWPTT